jgi:hypothetical protein
MGQEPQEVAVEEAQSFEDVSDKAFDRLNAPEDPKAEDAPEMETPESPAPDKVIDDKDNGDGELDPKTLADLKEGKILPKHRFDEVAQRMKAYESFGTPEQLQAALAKLAELEKMPPTEKKEAIDELSDDDKEIRDNLLRLFPQLKEIDKIKGTNEQLIAREQEQAQAREKALFDSGTNKIKELCEKNGLDCSSERRLKVHIGGVTDFLHANPELADKFYRQGDVSVIQSAFDEYFKEVFSGFQRKAKVEILNDKDNQKKLPKAPIKSGAPPVDQKKPLTKEQALDRAADRWIEAAKES